MYPSSGECAIFCMLRLKAMFFRGPDGFGDNPMNRASSISFGFLECWLCPSWLLSRLMLLSRIGCDIPDMLLRSSSDSPRFGATSDCPSKLAFDRLAMKGGSSMISSNLVSFFFSPWTMLIFSAGFLGWEGLGIGTWGGLP